MNILIAGVAGFIGTVLTNDPSKTDKIRVLGHTSEKPESIFSKDTSTWDKVKVYDFKQ